MRNRTAILGAAAAIAFSVMFSSPQASLAASTFVVNKIGNGADLTPGNGICDIAATAGLQCTLKAAIQEANALAGADTINFNITSASKVIQPPTALPQITQPVTINGYSQSGTSPNTQTVGNNAVLTIALDGVNAGAAASGLRVAVAGVVIKGLVIQRWGTAGIAVSSNSSNIAGNFIGTNAAGTVARPNRTGIVITGSGHLLGGISPGDRNLISGNSEDGILADGLTQSVIAGNYIGTTKNGSADLGNLHNAIWISNSSNLTIGGNDGSPGNVIAGDDQNGIACTDSHDLKIKGNLIGTDATGSVSIGLGERGINLARCDNVTIGGLTAVERNTIASTLLGIVLNTSDNSVIQGNRIGTNSSGSGAGFGNRFGAIQVTGTNTLIGGAGAAGNIIANSLNDAAGVFIAGSDATGTVVQGNSIAGNTGNGIQVWNSPAQILNNQIVANGKDGIFVNSHNPPLVGIRISGNVILANGALGIDLRTFNEDSFGVTPNDTGDVDSGPNRAQNFPVLASALRASNGVTTVQGSLNSTASTTFRIELFFANPDASGHGEAQAMLAFKSVTTAANGNVSFTFPLGSVVGGQRLSATAINEATGDTSEFSANVIVVQQP